MKSQVISDIVTRWEQTGLCQQFENTTPIATCLHVQAQFNETAKHGPDFNRVSIPLVVRLFRAAETAKNNTFINYLETTGDPQIHVFKTKYVPPAQQIDGRGHCHNLEAEADQLADIAKTLAEELDTAFAGVRNRDIIFRGLTTLTDGRLVMMYN